jgi:hypothetical protein
LLLEDCEAVEAALMFELLRLDVDNEELLSVKADKILEDVPATDGLAAAEFVTDE